METVLLAAGEVQPSRGVQPRYRGMCPLCPEAQKAQQKRQREGKSQEQARKRSENGLTESTVGTTVLFIMCAVVVVFACKDAKTKKRKPDIATGVKALGREALCSALTVCTAAR